jgi:4-amino-4-deoxy-L-arabinose transferase-like glycosyltransferase
LKNKPDFLYTGIFILFLLFITGIRLRLLSIPLERDEGEYAYFGQLILQGIPPYKLAYNLKLPGTYYSYALIMGIFGQTIQGIRLGLLLFNLGSLVFLFAIGKKLFNPFVAVLSTVVFGLLMVSPAVLGQAAHANQFVTFYMLGGTWFLVKALESKKNHWFALSGLMMGTAFLMKQSGVVFVLFGLSSIILFAIFSENRNLKHSLINLALFGTASAIPVVTAGYVMYVSGVFEKFWFWTIIYPEVYGSRVSAGEAWQTLSFFFTRRGFSFAPFWVFFPVGVISLFFYPGKRQSIIFTGVWLLFSVLSVVPGFYFRSHYFIPLLPVMGVCVAILFDFVNLKIVKHFNQISIVTSIVFVVLIIIGLNQKKEYFFTKSTLEVSKMLYPVCVFNESIPVAKYIKQNTDPNDKIFVLGSEPQIYFYANRKSATGYVYMYDLFFSHKYALNFQKEMAAEISKNQPKYIIFVQEASGWTVQPNTHRFILQWINQYISRNHYYVVGVIDLVSPTNTEYAWNEEARSYKVKSKQYIHILKRGE